MNCAIAFQLCHLNLLDENKPKNKGFKLFSAEGNKRGITYIGDGHDGI
jgi:hypothetical protein